MNWSKKYYKGLTNTQHKINDAWFKNMLNYLKDTGIFPPIFIQLLSTGEETGEIDNLALKASEFYSKQVTAIVDRLTSLIEPILIILVGGVVGVVIIVTYLPIFNFGSALAQ